MVFKKISFYFFILLFFSFGVQAQKQSSLSFGCNFSRFFKPLSNLEIPLYQFNQANPYIEEPYDMPEIFNGLSLSLMSGNKEIGLILSWNNKHGIAKAEGIASGYGETEYSIRKIKTRFNVVSIGPYFPIGERLKLGITGDLGLLKFKKKIAPEAVYGDAKWEKYYDKKGNWLLGLTLSLNYQLYKGRAIGLNVQPYAQILWLTTSPTYSTLTTEHKYYYNPSNFGLTAYLSLNWSN